VSDVLLIAGLIAAPFACGWMIVDMCKMWQGEKRRAERAKAQAIWASNDARMSSMKVAAADHYARQRERSDAWLAPKSMCSKCDQCNGSCLGDQSGIWCSKCNGRGVLWKTS
jgi:hypothetical protein